MNPRDTKQNLQTLCQLVPECAPELLESVDQTLGVETCPKTNRKFLTCDYNRDENSFRSPWSGEYVPALSDGTTPSAETRMLEVLANDSFDVYRDLYFEGGISSVYLWDQDEGIAGAALFKKHSEQKAAGNDSANWDSIHVFEIEPNGRRSATYRLTSTVMLDLQDSNSKIGKLDLAGSITRQHERNMATEDSASHIANIGTLIEEVESSLRNTLNEVYFGKTKDILGDLRSVAKLTEVEEEKARQSEVAKSLGR